MATLVPLSTGSYNLDNRVFDAQRCVNLYPTISETRTSAPPQSALKGTAGLSLFCHPVTAATRAAIEINGRAFFVIGSGLYEIYSDGTCTSRGTLNTADGYVGLATNGTQICLVDGDYGYIFTLATNILAEITDPYFLGANTVTFLDGYFIFNKPNTNIYYISAINDGTTGDALDYAAAEATPTNLVAVVTVHQQLWLFKTDCVQMAYNSGAADFPFASMQGTTIFYGCAAKGTAITSANTVFWLGQDKEGRGTVWMAEGFQPSRISTYAIEEAIKTYEDIDKTVAYTYQENGHFFYVLVFTSANTTWVYDIGLKKWHEKAYFNPNSNTYERHRGQVHIFAFNKHLIGDYANGKIYEQSLDFYDDDGDAKVFLLTAMHMKSPSLNYVFYERLQLSMQVGVGLITGDDADIDPYIVMQFSNDGGYTWGNEIWRTVGKIGEYTRRVIWNRLGRARDRIFRFQGSAKVQFFIIGAYIDAKEGNN